MNGRLFFGKVVGKYTNHHPMDPSWDGQQPSISQVEKLDDILRSVSEVAPCSGKIEGILGGEGWFKMAGNFITSASFFCLEFGRLTVETQRNGGDFQVPC